MTPDAAVRAALDQHLPAGAAVGVAVSGGSDSVALLVLLAEAMRNRCGGTLHAATVDHGLRHEAAGEARLVSDTAARLGVSHDILHWRDGDAQGRAGWDGTGNLQASARATRYGALRRWAAARGLSHVCLGHTMDDQAETVLLRLARGSGVDGLSGMAAHRRDGTGAPVWLRPLLGHRREALRTVLRQHDIHWTEDPGNADLRFARVRARAALAEPLLAGLDVPTLAGTAARMAAAREVLWHAARTAAQAIATVDHGAVGFDRQAFAALPDDTRWRLLAAAVRQVAGLPYRPRLAALIRAEGAAMTGTTATVAGCVLSAERGRIWVDREPAALAGCSVPLPGIWDGRWRVTGPTDAGLHMAALGPEGLAQRVGWRDLGLRRRAILTAPGVWDGDRLVAAPTLSTDACAAAVWSSKPVWDIIQFCDTLRPD